MDNIKDKLARIAGLVESGDELERDLALAMLREVYAEIKFGTETTTPSVADATATPPPEGNSSGLLPSALPGGEPLSSAILLDPATIDDTAPAYEEPVAGIKEPVSVEEEEPAVKEEEPATEEEEPALEVPEPPIVSRRVAPEVIRSLYGPDEEPEPIPTPEDPDPRSEEKSADPLPPVPTDPAHRPATPATSATPASTTLGDAMAVGHRTLGETLRGGGETSMASRIAAAERPGLKRSIGLNDRFLMIRDMFDGDADGFDRAITRLDAFTDLDEAVIWIHDNFDWSADNKGAALLVGLLERKLGH